MQFWIDAQISPSLALWINQQFPDISAKSVRSLGLLKAADKTIFYQAREAGAIVITKDIDFVYLSDALGIPPQIVWLNCGNTSNAFLRELLTKRMSDLVIHLKSGERLVEIR